MPSVCRKDRLSFLVFIFFSRMGADLGNYISKPLSKFIEIKTISKHELSASRKVDLEQTPNQSTIFRLHNFCIPNLQRSHRTHLYPVTYKKHEHIRIWYLDKHFRLYRLLLAFQWGFAFLGNEVYGKGQRRHS